jgi:hypothetical protein
MEQWRVQHCAFIVETFLKNGDSVVKTQRIFREYFNIARHGKVSFPNTLQLYVENFRTSASALKRKPPGSVRTFQSPPNIEAVRHKES